MTERIPTYVYAPDPVTQSGVSAALRGRPEVELLADSGIDEARVALVAVDELDDDSIRVIRALQRNGVPRVVAVVANPDQGGLLAAVEAGVSGLLRRTEATPEALASAVQSAVKGDGTLPPDLLGRLMNAVGRLQEEVLNPRGLTFSALSQREIDVLQLVAEGHDTAEVAQTLCYSERTIKNIVHDVTMRLNLRNRTHAVAYALRQGLI